jgi:hypothetical protein
MISAGLLGTPGIGFKQDFNASANLKENAPEVYERYKAGSENSFLGFSVVGLDGSKTAVLKDGGKELARAVEIMKADNKPVKSTEDLSAWWVDAQKTAEADKGPVETAGLHGGRQALKLTSFVPASMAVIYLLLILYFKAKGGYRAVHVSEEEPEFTSP